MDSFVSKLPAALDRRVRAGADLILQKLVAQAEAAEEINVRDIGWASSSVGGASMPCFVLFVLFFCLFFSFCAPGLCLGLVTRCLDAFGCGFQIPWEMS